MIKISGLPRDRLCTYIIEHSRAKLNRSIFTFYQFLDIHYPDKEKEEKEGTNDLHPRLFITTMK